MPDFLIPDEPPSGGSEPGIKTDTDYELVVAVSQSGGTFIIEAPPEVWEYLSGDMGSHTELGGFPDHIPGVFRVKARFWFQEGYFEGYPHPGESSCGLEAVKWEQIRIVPA